MSKFRELVESVMIEQNLDEGWGKTLGTLAALGTIGLGSYNASINNSNPVINTSNQHTLAHFEHGGKGHHAIVKDNYGGYSYGYYQLSTKRNGSGSPFDKFLKYLEQQEPKQAEALKKFGGWKAAYNGTEAFKSIWHKLADNSRFQQAYFNFIENEYDKPLYNQMNKTTQVPLNYIVDWANKDDSVKNVLRSCAIQHGVNGAFKLIYNTVKYTHPKTEIDFINNLYNRRIKQYPSYRNRYQQEKRLVLSKLS